MQVYPMPASCPVCRSEMAVTRLACPRCETVVEGRFGLGALGGLDAEQLAFLVTFVRCEGKLKAVEAELGISYPTVRARLQELIRAMGFEPGERALPDLAEAEAERRRILADLDAGRIDAAEAMALLRDL